MLCTHIHCSTCGWDHVLQGLVMLGFNLMELYAPKSASKLSSWQSIESVACLCIYRSYHWNTTAQGLLPWEQAAAQDVQGCVSNFMFGVGTCNDLTKLNGKSPFLQSQAVV